MQPGETLKWCSGCQTEKPPTEFYRNRSRPDGLQNLCKPCSNLAHRKSITKHREIRKEQHARERLVNKQYGMRVEDYELMLWDQNGRCAICMNIMSKPKVDWDGKNNRARALLCSNCYSGLYAFGYSTENLLKAVSYLDAYRHF
ncbi:MAG: endonuclease domain-containing protein [Candidatus Nitrosotenuis sp.]